jgi:hypothetical protein
VWPTGFYDTWRLPVVEAVGSREVVVVSTSCIWIWGRNFLQYSRKVGWFPNKILESGILESYRILHTLHKDRELKLARESPRIPSQSPKVIFFDFQGFFSFL